MNTQDPNNSDQLRNCSQCGLAFEPSTKKHKFCSTNYRVAHQRFVKTVTDKEQEAVVQQ